MDSLYDNLRKNQYSDYYPLHMPGHKRNLPGSPMENFYGIDITEIDGFDNLHCPNGILQEMRERAAELFGAEESFLLVNGSTGGILSAVSAVFRSGDTILMARNCHKAVYHSVYLNQLRAEYLYPSFVKEYHICGGISSEKVSEMLTEHPEIRGILLTSPTYDGVVSDIASIVQAAHERKVPVIVDEAHGAHFCLDPRFPKSAVACGADLVIQSIHKTLPAFTQTAVLHVQGTLIDRDRLKRFLQIYQTSSPSYILMAGIGQCLSILETQRGKFCDSFFKRDRMFCDLTKKLRNINVLSMDNRYEKEYDIVAVDPGKKILSVKGTNCTGQQLYRLLLEKYHLQPEMAAQDYVTAILTVCDKEEGVRRLADALQEIDADLQGAPGEELPSVTGCTGTACCDIHCAMDAEYESIPLKDAVGKVSAGFVNVYPPGIPLIVPGETFTEEVVGQIRRYRNQEFTVEGMTGNGQKVNVVKEKRNAQN